MPSAPMLALLPPDDEWEELYGPDGNLKGRVHKQTGEYEPVRKRQFLTPEEQAAEGMLPEAMRRSIALRDGRLVNPLTYLALKNFEQTADAQNAARKVARVAAKTRNEDKPLASLWEARDDLIFDQQQGKEYRQAASNMLATISLLDQQQRELVGYITKGLIEGTAASYLEAQEAKERDRRLFELSLTPEERAREHEIRTMEAQGKLKVDQLRAEAEVAATQEARRHEFDLEQELLAEKWRIPALIGELDELYQRDRDAYIAEQIRLLLLLDATLNELVSGDAEQRQRARNKLLLMNAPQIWHNVMALLEAEARRAKRAQRYRPPEKPDDGAKGEQ